MDDCTSGRERQLLERIAVRVMRERGLLPEFGAEVMHEVGALKGPAPADGGGGMRDLRGLLWCSIDNDDSRDLDQLSAAEDTTDGGARLWVAVADVDALVARGSKVDGHAHANTTSVYTPARIFSMLPERLSTDLTSLNQDEDRAAVVIEMTIDREGRLLGSAVFQAAVRNRAKLAYPSLGAWLVGEGPAPEAMTAIPGLAESIRLQDRMTREMRELRHEAGALDLETIEVRAQMKDDLVESLHAERKNRAKELIEDLMVAANGVVARFLAAKRFPSIRRVVRSPERWERIRELALEFRETLPGEPDARALEQFLVRRRVADPLRFPDLSLAVIKMMGAGEYVLEAPGETPTGHFGLAVRDYTHSTAPNRRYPDVITQRLVKAALQGAKPPYGKDELAALAAHCTEKEDAANKVERHVRKSAAACFLASRIGQEFEGIVTGASEKGTWARVIEPPFEGKVQSGAKGLDVGDRVRVKLLATDVERGYIDLAAIGGRRGHANHHNHDHGR